MSTLVTSPREYTPEKLSRRGEITAWALAGVVALVWGVARTTQPGTASLLPLPVLVLFGLAAASISFGNWVDQQTVLRVAPEGVFFANGLRKVHLPWSDIQSIEVAPAQWGARRVHVMGAHAHFFFCTLGRVERDGKIQGQTGFARGHEILQTIILAAGLHRIEQSAPGYYYARD